MALQASSFRPLIRVASVARLSAAAAVFGLATAGCATARPAAGPPPLSDTERAIHLLSRTTYGVRPRDVEELLRVGASAWLDVQMDPAPIQKDVVSFDTVAAAKPSEPSRAVAMLERAQELLAMARAVTETPQAMTISKLTRAAESERQLEEVLTDFWFNHFNVSLTKSPAMGATIGLYEQQAIRAHVFGRFHDMLLATARQHPAMQMYLDNYFSSAPGRDSTGLRGGLNENYARELLELHTLGVDGGYTQKDVIEVARALTGWGVPTRVVRATTARPAAIAPQTGSLTFLFEAQRHDLSEKVVLGRILPAGRGVEDGLDLLEMLARHPSTAHHIATKLVTHFVADDPPAELVDELARVFLATDGDLREVTRALFTSEVFYRRAYYRSKAKRPFEFLASTLRLSGANLEAWHTPTPTPTYTRAVQPLYQLLQRTRHVPYSEPAPTGYPSTADEWISAGALLERMNFSLDFAFGRLAPQGMIDPFQVLGIAGAAGVELLQSNTDQSARLAGLRNMTDVLLEKLLFGAAAPGLADLIVEDLAGQSLENPAALVSRAIALTLGSPEFQRY